MNRKKNTTGREGYLGLLLSVALFVCGILVGTFTAGAMDEGGSSALYGIISDYVTLVREGTFSRPELLSVLLSTYKDQVLVMFMGLSIPGFALIPIVNGVRGFFLSFSIAAFIKVFGTGGVLTAIGLFGLTAIVSVPCLIFSSAICFQASANLCRSVLIGSRSAAKLYDRAFFLRCGLCLAALVVPVILEMYVVPWFVSAVSVFL